MVEPSPLTAVVMAKDPLAGRVKTRLVSGGLFSEAAAGRLAEAMLRCTIRRLTICFDHIVLAAAPDHAAPRIAHRLGLTDLSFLDQGHGSLGERVDRVWTSLASTGPVAFFGGDSPDVPLDVLRSIPAALEDDPVALGPTPDGGYWTLAARGYHPQVLREIDWGSDRVYDQTCRRAREAGLSVSELMPWPDVDEPDDVLTLHRRLNSLPREQGETDLALRELAETIGSLVEMSRCYGDESP